MVSTTETTSAATGSAAAGFDREALCEMYRRMRTIRVFEEQASRLYRSNEIPGFLHLSIGQEASAVGSCWPLDERDVVTSTHRGHGHCIAKGLDVHGMVAELMGRQSGTCQGRGGSMHIADPRRGVFGANGIVAGGLPIAVGAGTAAQLRSQGGVVVAFFGDGAAAQGAFHESVNLAAVWDLPMVFCCENNQYAEFASSAAQHRATLEDRARGYGVGYRHVDGNDVLAVARCVGDVVGNLRTGDGPVIVEADTYRWHGHYEGDPERYRQPEEVAAWKERDPLVTLALHIEAEDSHGQVEEINAEVDELMRDAIEAARAAPEPTPDTLHHYVTAPREPVSEPAEPDGEPLKMMHAIHNALEYELRTDESVLLAGVDVGEGGNVFALTRGLAEQYPGRVRDTPISESAVIGTGIGAAMAGMRPVVELMYFDFIGVCFDQLLNQAAKLRFMTGGGASLPMVVRTQFGAGRSSGSQHSQSLEAILAHVPGLSVVMPSTVADTYGLLRAAIRDPNPVVFVENRLLYGRKGPRPPEHHMVPLGRAKVVREGVDVTLVSYSKMMQDCEAAAATLAEEGISVELIDLRTIVPLDKESVLRSVAKTNRLVIAHQAVGEFGVGAELAATAAAPTAAAVPPLAALPLPAPERQTAPSRRRTPRSTRRIVDQQTHDSLRHA